MGDRLFEKFDRREQFLFAFGLFFHAGEGVFGHLKVGEDEFEGDHFDIVDRIDLAGDVDHVDVFKAADDLDDRVGFADVGEELVAKAFSFRGSFDESRDIDETNRGIDDFFTMGLVGEGAEPRVVNVDDAEVGIDRAEGVVFRGDLFAGQCIE